MDNFFSDDMMDDLFDDFESSQSSNSHPAPDRTISADRQTDSQKETAARQQSSRPDFRNDPLAQAVLFGGLLPKAQTKQNAKPEKQESSKKAKQKTACRYVPVVIENQSEFARTHSKEELENYAKNKLQAISPNEEIEALFAPTASQDVVGFSAAAIGDPHGTKYEFFTELAELLYDTGKTGSAKPCRLSFSQIDQPFQSDRLYIVDKLQDAITNLFGQDDYAQEEDNSVMAAYSRKLNLLIAAPGTAYIILDATSTEATGFFTIDPRLPYLFGRKAHFGDLCDEDIYLRYTMALPERHQRMLSDAFRVRMLDFLAKEKRYYPFSNQELALYLATYSSRFPDRLMLPASKGDNRTLEEAFADIIGLQKVKTQIQELANYLKAQTKLEKIGIKTPPFNLHMLLLGNPGVGKTTMARIIAHVLFALGYVKEDKLIEVTSKDLVSASGSLTGVKTNKVIMRAMGGVLFVDEAYSLANTGQAGLEAVANIVKAMEDYKGEFVCMFAGYTMEMQTFLRLNSGIQSRIQFEFNFDDYTPDELFEIYKLKLKKTGMLLDRSAEPAVRALCKTATMIKNSGNGRFVDKMVQRTLTRHASRKDFDDMKPSQAILITKASVPTVEEIMASIGRFSG